MSNVRYVPSCTYVTVTSKYGHREVIPPGLVDVDLWPYDELEKSTVSVNDSSVPNKVKLEFIAGRLDGKW